MGEAVCQGHPALSSQFAPLDIPPRTENKALFVVNERLYLDADGNVVKASDPRKQTLLAAAGSVIPLEDARRYGLLQEQVAPTVESAVVIDIPVVSVTAKIETPKAPVKKSVKKPVKKSAKRPARVSVKK